MTSKVVAGFGAALLAFSVAASAQSLGDLAKQEEARRKAVKSPGKVYTNDSLHTEPAPSTPPASAAPSSSAPADKSATTTGDKAAADKDKTAGKPADQAGDKTADKGEAKDEAYWRKRIADARTALDRSQSFAEALQTRINSLTTDFTNRDDPAQRALIAADRDKALAQLDQLKKEIDENTKAIANIQEDARKAGVPAGWVR